MAQQLIQKTKDDENYWIFLEYVFVGFKIMFLDSYKIIPRGRNLDFQKNSLRN